jgi:outer membrane immunogenic protein
MRGLGFAAALSALAAVMATSADAADMVAPLPVFDWTAFHIGAGVGGNYGFTNQQGDVFYDEGDRFTDPNYLNLLQLDLSSDTGDAGFFGTIEAGYDYQMDQIVFGVLANYDFGKTKMGTSAKLTSGTCASEDCSVSASMSTEVGDSWAIGGRLGFLPTERTLLYALGGYTQAKINQNGWITADVQQLGLTGFNEGISNSGWQGGWFVGAGVETMLTDNISLKGEYRYNDYGSVSSSRSDLINTNPDQYLGGDRSDDVTVQSVRAVLSWRFSLGM